MRVTGMAEGLATVAGGVLKAVFGAVLLVRHRRPIPTQPRLQRPRGLHRRIHVRERLPLLQTSPQFGGHDDSVRTSGASSSACVPDNSTLGTLSYSLGA